MWKVYMLTLIMITPILVNAAGLVPCGGVGEDSCQTCHVVVLIKNVMDWLAIILGILFVIIIAVMGLRLVSSVGAVEAKTQSRRIIASATVGYVIFLAGWMIVDLFLKMFVNDTAYGAWNNIQCVAQPEPQKVARVTATGDNKSVLSSSDVNNRVSSIQIAEGTSVGSLTTSAATKNGLNPEQTKIFKSLISQESNNCTNKTGPATNFGTAYGCGQLLISTARGLDPELKGLTDEQVKQKLIDDDAYNLSLSAKYYRQLLDKNGGNTELALANYNGGNAAVLPSNDCPNLRRWQCVWDSAGCYNTEKTDCVPNTGYKETRHYVENVKNIADKL